MEIRKISRPRSCSGHCTELILVPRGRAPFGQHQESILGADQKEHGLWGRECTELSFAPGFWESDGEQSCFVSFDMRRSRLVFIR